MRTHTLLALSLLVLGCHEDQQPAPGSFPPEFPPGVPPPAVPPATQSLSRVNLASDTGDAAHTDPLLINAWGMAFNPAGPIWISAAGSGVSTIYDSSGAPLPLVVTIATLPGAPEPATPTGQVYNGTPAFFGDLFIFATEQGTINGWHPSTGTVAPLRVDSSAFMAKYKGLTLLSQGSASRIYAADFHNARVDIFDGAYTPLLIGGFSDPLIPPGFAPFNIQAIGSRLFVTYALRDPAGQDDVKGAGNGFVDIFDFDGNLLQRFASGRALNSPWGVARAPADFGAMSGMILIGNFGDGHINAFDFASGELRMTTAGTIDGLWALAFGNDTPGAAHNQLFFTAGPDEEKHGLFGRLDMR